MPNLNHGARRPPHRQSGSSNERLRRALAEQERFLKQNPQLRAFQAEIDRLLDRSGDAHGRMAVLATLMQGKLLEMQNQFKRLNRYLHRPALPGNRIAAPQPPQAPTDCRLHNCI